MQTIQPAKLQPLRPRLNSPATWLLILSLSASITTLGQNDPTPAPNDSPKSDRSQLRDRPSNRPIPQPQSERGPSQPPRDERGENRSPRRDDQIQRQPDFERPQSMPPSRGQDRFPVVERSRHIRAAIRHLHAAGLHDQAERLESSIKDRRLHAEGQGQRQNQNPPLRRQPLQQERNRELNRDSNGRPELAQRLENLQREVQELRRSLDSQRNRPDRSIRPPAQDEPPR